MPDNINPDAKRVINRSVNVFKNLLKEFPKNAADDFIYDESTLGKINDAAGVLTEMAALIAKKATAGESEQGIIKKSHKTLTLLMEELPRDPADEFLYDRNIHRQVESARETIEQLSIFAL